MGANLTSEIASGNPPLQKRSRLDLSGPVAPALALFGSALFALSIAPVPDHGYQFYLGSRLLDGARLYVDIAAADMHPPLFTWLAAALEAVGRLFNSSGLWLYPGFIVGITALVVSALWRIGPRSPLLATVLVLALLPLAGPYLGQGEHLALLLALPYLFATAAAINGREQSRMVRLLIAIAAGIGLAMKPHFALVWAGVELYVALQRGWRSILRVEAVAIGTVFVLYVIATAIFTPEFFPLLPWLMELYPRFAPVPLLDVLFDARALLLLTGLAAAWLARRDPASRSLTDLLAIAALAMYSAMLLQVKGWGYHWYPVNALSLVLIGIALRPKLDSVRWLAPSLAIAGVLWMNHQVDRTARLLVSSPSYLSQTMEMVELHGGGRPIVALAQTINAGFPLVNYSGAQWASPYAHLWMIPAMYDASWYRGEPWRYRRVGKWATLEQEIFDRSWAAIERDRPAVLFIEGPLENGFNMGAYFATDPRFHDLFVRSTPVGKAGHYLVLRTPFQAEPRP